MFIINDYLSKLEEFFELRNLAEKTRANHLSSLNCYLSWLLENHIMPEDATYDDIRSFNSFMNLYKVLSEAMYFPSSASKGTICEAGRSTYLGVFIRLSNSFFSSSEILFLASGRLSINDFFHLK